jgi:hypothetical protein
MFPFLILMSSLANSPASPRNTACEVALLHATMMLEEVKTADRAQRIIFVGGNHMPYQGNRESWWAEGKPAVAPDEAILSKVKVAAQRSAIPACESLASLISARGIGFSDVFPNDPGPVALMISVSLPAISDDGRSAILLDAIGSAKGGGSGRVCYYDLVDSESWKRSGCTNAWIAD